MSYALVLFRPDAGIDPRTLAREETLEDGARDPAKEAAKRRLADALIAHDRRLEERERDYDEVSSLHKLRADHAYQRLRCVELTDASPGGSGVQVTLFDDHAAVTIPHWHEGAAARTQLARVWRYLDIICEATGYEVFDVELDRAIARGAFEDVLASYERATARVRGIAEPVRRRRPWWKFW
jgi:hypothetical protein